MKALFSETGDKESNLGLLVCSTVIETRLFLLLQLIFSFCNMNKNLEPVNEQFLGFGVFWWSSICASNLSSRHWASLVPFFKKKNLCYLGQIASVTWLHWDDSTIKSIIQTSDQRVNVIIKDPHLQLWGRNVAFRVSHMFGGVAWEESRDQVGGRAGSKWLDWVTFKYKHRAYVSMFCMDRMDFFIWYHRRLT